MRRVLNSIFGGLLIMATQASGGEGFYGLTAKTIDGKPATLGEFKGKVAVVVNTASQCGYTPQYTGLQKLYDTYKAKGVVVLGFPSNDFGAQEPGSEQEIKQFCELKFNVKFPMFSKVKVKGAEKDPVYKYLTENAPQSLRGEVDWNFEKFLIAKDGKVIGRFKSKVKPLDTEMTGAIEEALR